MSRNILFLQVAIVILAVVGLFYFHTVVTRETPDPVTVAPDVIAVKFPPPVEYKAWWGQMQRCTGFKKDIEDVEFYVAIHPRYVQTHLRSVGEVRYEPNRIYLPASELYTPGVVSHEMVHILLEEEGHPEPAFGFCAPRNKGARWGWKKMMTGILNNSD